MCLIKTCFVSWLVIRLHCAIQCAAAETKFYCAINLCRRSITSRQIIHREFGLQYLFSTHSTQLTSCINSLRFCVCFTWPSSCDWSSNDEFIFYILLTTTIKWSDKHKGSFSVSLQGNSLCLLLKKGPLDRTNTCPCINTTTSTYTGIFESNYKEKELRNRPTDLATKNQTR